MPSILLFLLRKTGPELTSMPIFLYFICGTPTTAWLDKWCHVHTQEPHRQTPGRWSRTCTLNRCAPGWAPNAIHKGWLCTSTPSFTKRTIYHSYCLRQRWADLAAASPAVSLPFLWPTQGSLTHSNQRKHLLFLPGWLNQNLAMKASWNIFWAQQ